MDQAEIRYEQSALRQVFASRLYSGATVAMLLSGIGVSAAAPQIVLYLVRELDTSLPVAGFFYLTSLAAPVAGYLIGSYSDRTGKRLGLFRLCAIAGFLGWVGIAIASQAWMPFVISALVLGFSGAAASQLFAAVHDDLTRKPTAAAEDIVAIIRMALTAGWSDRSLGRGSRPKSAFARCSGALRCVFWRRLCRLVRSMSTHRRRGVR